MREYNSVTSSVQRSTEFDAYFVLGDIPVPKITAEVGGRDPAVPETEVEAVTEVGNDQAAVTTDLTRVRNLAAEVHTINLKAQTRTRTRKTTLVLRVLKNYGIPLKLS